jgi:hypothetical protein
MPAGQPDRIAGNGGRKTMGLFDRIKLLGRLDAPQAEEPGGELGDFIEPGSSPEISAIPSGAGGASNLEQLKELHASGLIDTETYDMIKSTMTNASAQVEQLHDSGMMSDEIYAQAMASMNAATSGTDAAADAAERELLRRGKSAPATVLAAPAPIGEAGSRVRLKLQVHPAGGSPYEVDCTVAAARPAAGLKVGDFVQVKVDPADPQHVAIDPT